MNVLDTSAVKIPVTSAATNAAAETAPPPRALPKVAVHTEQQESAKQDLQAAMRRLESQLLGMGRALEFRVDDRTGTTIVTVRDKTSGDVIRQIPSEEALRLAENLEIASSALLNTSA